MASIGICVINNANHKQQFPLVMSSPLLERSIIIRAAVHKWRLKVQDTRSYRLCATNGHEVSAGFQYRNGDRVFVCPPGSVYVPPSKIQEKLDFKESERYMYSSPPFNPNVAFSFIGEKIEYRQPFPDEVRAFALCIEEGRAPNLKSLVVHSYWEVTSEIFVGLLRVLPNYSTLETLELYYISFSDAHWDLISELISSPNTRLRQLTFVDTNHVTTFSLEKLCQSLAANRTLKSLFCRFYFGVITESTMLEMFSKNKTLENLKWEFRLKDSDISWNSIYLGLKTNSTLKRFECDWFDPESLVLSMAHKLSVLAKESNKTITIGAEFSYDKKNVQHLLRSFIRTKLFLLQNNLMLEILYEIFEIYFDLVMDDWVVSHGVNATKPPKIEHRVHVEIPNNLNEDSSDHEAEIPLFDLPEHQTL
jgi:hypothetical protein